MSAVGRQHCFSCTRSKRIRPDLLRMQTVQHQHGTPRSSAAPETAHRFEFLLSREKKPFPHVGNKRGGIINIIVMAPYCILALAAHPSMGLFRDPVHRGDSSHQFGLWHSCVLFGPAKSVARIAKPPRLPQTFRSGLVK